MDSFEQENVIDTVISSNKGHLEESFNHLKLNLATALDLNLEDIRISFPTLKNFYSVNNIYKSSWAIYLDDVDIPKLLFSGNFLIQGKDYSKRSRKSPFGADAFLDLSSLANTYSYDASIFKQNWTMDLNLTQTETSKINFTVKEYKEFLKILNRLRALWLLHLCEEARIDFVICEFSEPSDQIYFADLEKIESGATKIKSYFKLVSENAMDLFKNLAVGTEFEGKFYSLQPGTWINEDVLIELQNLYPEKFYESSKNVKLSASNNLKDIATIDNPFKVEKTSI